MRWRPRGRLTIATRLVASFLLMASLPLIVVLFLSTRSDESDLKSKGLVTVSGTADAKADRIEAFTTEHREAAVALARTPAVADRFRRLEVAVQSSGVDSAEYAQVEASLRPFFSRYLRDFGFTDLFLMATTGEGVFAVNEREGLGFNYETGPFKGTERAVAFRRVRDSKALTLVGFDSFSVNSRSAYIALPLNDAGGVIGVAVFEVGKEPVFTVVGDHGGLGETGETLLGVRRDDAVVIVAPARFDDELPKGRSIGPGSTERGLRAAVDGQSGQGVVRDYRGKRTLAAWRPLPSLGLGLEVKMDVSEVLAPVREQRRTLFRLAIIGLPVLIGGALLAARSVSKPITRLTEATRTVAAGNREFQVPVDRDDEVGELSRAFNTMTAELAASYASVEETVRVRTAELALLQQAAVAANAAAAPAEATRTALELVCRHTGWVVGHALLVEEAEGGRPEVVSGRVWYMADRERYLPFQEATKQVTLSDLELPRQVLETREATWVIDPEPTDERFPRAAAAAEAGLRTAMTFPILVGHNVVGMLEFFSTEPAEPEPAIVSLVTDVGTQLGRVIERMRADDALRAAKEAAEVANEAKSTFLASMSHEFRTPLNAIIGYAEMLEEEAGDMGQEELLPDLGKIRSAGRHLLGVINDVLDLSKIEAGRTDLYLETFAVETLVDEVAATVRPMAEAKGNRLEVRKGGDLGEMHSDLTKVRQTLLNLTGNASKFTEAGTVTLTARRDGDDVVFEVTDTGIGIAPEHMDRLFQPFSQAESSTARRFGGTGLGLVISRRFCEMLGGAVTVRSEAGVGSTFTVRLPARFEDRAEPTLLPVPPPPPAAPVPAANGSAVLVIEDDATVRQLLEGVLTEEGYRVVTAGGDADTVELARQLHPDAITLDLALPSLAGWNLLAAIKADSELSDVPVIVLLVVEEAAGVPLGATDYLTKPVQRDRLVGLLRTHCRDRNAPVLVVEDDADTREMLQRMLEREGFEVAQAADGRAGLDRVAENRPSLILLDLLMPQMNGFEFLAELQTRPEWRSIPVVVVTAKDLTAEEHARLSGQVAEVLRKGAYSRERLLSEVRERVAAWTAGKT
ncbi:MAG TPA: response regulator [Acidimicrobiia bacterium]|nr:response regulator [Acidimicrobiia bacterium]